MFPNACNSYTRFANIVSEYFTEFILILHLMTLCSFIKSSCGRGGAIFPKYFEGNWYLGFSNLKLRSIIVNGAFSLSIESNNFLVSLILTGYFDNQLPANKI